MKKNHFFYHLAGCLLAVMTAALVSCGSDDEPDEIKPDNTSFPADKTGMASDAPALAAKLKLGWNLGNSLEVPGGETGWGNPATTKKLIDAVKAAGFTTVRIPCAWSSYVEGISTSNIRQSWLARVKEVVDYCVDNNMYAIINIHWDGGWLEENPQYVTQTTVLKKEKAIWEQIATYFRDYDEHLLFAGTNEVHNTDYSNPTAENLAVQASFNQTFVDAVRSTGGRNAWRNLIVQSFNTSIEHAIAHLKMPTDPTTGRLMAEVHYYDPYEYALMEKNESWATVKYFWGKEGGFDQYGEVSNWGQEDYVREQFGKMKSNFVDKGIPVIIGEYGATYRVVSDAELQKQVEASRNYYFGYVTKTALANDIVPIYWDNGSTGANGCGLFDRATGKQVHADAIQAIVTAK